MLSVHHQFINPDCFNWIVAQSPEGTPELGHAPVELGIIKLGTKQRQLVGH